MNEIYYSILYLIVFFVGMICIRINFCFKNYVDYDFDNQFEKMMNCTQLNIFDEIMKYEKILILPYENRFIIAYQKNDSRTLEIKYFGTLFEIDCDDMKKSMKQHGAKISYIWDKYFQCTKIIGFTTEQQAREFIDDTFLSELLQRKLLKKY